MPQLFHFIGDATVPYKTPAIICHVCNDEGKWGRGFVLALSKRSPLPEYAYRTWYRDKEYEDIPFRLGETIFVPFSTRIRVANMIAQHGIAPENNVPPIRYDALHNCLEVVQAYARDMGATVHGPRFGADLAGGSWDKIEEIIKDTLQVDTYIYTLDKEKNKWPGTEYWDKFDSDTDISDVLD